MRSSQPNTKQSEGRLATPGHGKKKVGDARAACKDAQVRVEKRFGADAPDQGRTSPKPTSGPPPDPPAHVEKRPAPPPTNAMPRKADGQRAFLSHAPAAGRSGWMPLASSPLRRRVRRPPTRRPWPRGRRHEKIVIGRRGNAPLARTGHSSRRHNASSSNRPPPTHMAAGRVGGRADHRSRGPIAEWRSRGAPAKRRAVLSRAIAPAPMAAIRQATNATDGRPRNPRSIDINPLVSTTRKYLRMPLIDAKAA